MHENREISCTSWSTDQDRSAKAINRTADMNVQEKSDCAVVPVNQPNNEGQQPSRLDAAGQSALAADLEKLWSEHNKGENGRTLVCAEYLEVTATRA